MKLKGSIAVFAVAAAFAGNVAANEIQDKAAECRALIGYAAFVASTATPRVGTGAWLAVDGASDQFTPSNIIVCSIPKNKKVNYLVGTIPAARCGLYSKLASADNKFVPLKESQSLAILEALPAQTQKLVWESKLTEPGKASIDAAVASAQTCVSQYIELAY
jgi:hypothetical protein